MRPFDLDTFTNQGYYAAQQKFCEQFIEQFNQYNLLITGEDEYKWHLDARDRAMQNILIEITKQQKTQADYDALVISFEAELKALRKKIGQDPYVKKPADVYKKNLNRLINQNQKTCREIGVPILDRDTLYTYDTYKQIFDVIHYHHQRIKAALSKYKK